MLLHAHVELLGESLILGPLPGHDGTLGVGSGRFRLVFSGRSPQERAAGGLGGTARGGSSATPVPSCGGRGRCSGRCPAGGSWSACTATGSSRPPERWTSAPPGIPAASP